MTTEKKEPYIQLPLRKIARGDHLDEATIHLVPPGLGKQVLSDASEIGRDREAREQSASSKAPTKPTHNIQSQAED
jgi:hypothetical protein